MQYPSPFAWHKAPATRRQAAIFRTDKLFGIACLPLQNCAQSGKKALKPYESYIAQATCTGVTNDCAFLCKPEISKRFFKPLESDLNQRLFSAAVRIFHPDFSPAIVYPAPGIF